MSAPNHALRRLVADLAVLHADDIAAVLDGLDGAERKTVEEMLQEYAAHFDRAPVAPAEDRGNYDLTRLSPWLAQRLEGEPGMTADARRALRDCAVRLYPMPSQPVSSNVRARTNLFGRITSIIPTVRP